MRKLVQRMAPKRPSPATVIGVVMTLLLLGNTAHAAVITVGATGCDYTDLQAAVDAASSGDEVRLRAQELLVGSVSISKSLEINGGYSVCGDASPGLGLVSRLAGNFTDGVLRISGGAGVTVELKRLVITEGGGLFGGGINVSSGSTLRVATVTVISNIADFGGGVYIGPDSLLQHIGPLLVQNNQALKGGGIFANDRGRLDFTTGGFNAVDILNNGAVDEGGGIYLSDGAELLTDPNRLFTVDRNRSELGAGIFAETSAVINARGVEIIENNGIAGGGLYVAGDHQAAAMTTIVFDEHSLINNNVATRGGGIYLADGDGYLVAISGQVSSNEAAEDGGGIWFGGETDLDLSDALLQDNSAGRHGGGLYMEGQSAVLNVSDVFSIFNRAGSDGGGAYLSGGTVSINFKGNFSRNLAGNNGGGFAVTNGANLSVDANVGPGALQVLGNIAESGDGGGLFVSDASLTLRYAVLGDEGRGNRAPFGSGGGAYIATNAFWRMYSTRIEDNYAWEQGGGLYIAGGGPNGGFLIDGAPDNIGVPPRGVLADCDISILGTNRYCGEVRGNSSGGTGGAIYLTESASNPRSIRNLAIVANRGTGAAAGVFVGAPELEMENVLVARHAEHDAIYVRFEGGLTMDHATVVYNDFGMGGGGRQTMQIFRSLFWGNGSDLSRSFDATVTGECNLSKDIDVPDALRMHPRFIATARGQYRLSDQSPAVDACTFSPLAADLDGFQRPAGVDYDIGALEGAWGTSETLLSDSFETGPLAAPIP